MYNSGVAGSYDTNGPLFEMFNSKFRHYIDMVDNLRSIGLDQEVPLPQVVVLGVQGVGKSSVLESISGVQLPRGTGRNHTGFQSSIGFD